MRLTIGRASVFIFATGMAVAVALYAYDLNEALQTNIVETQAVEESSCCRYELGAHGLGQQPEALPADTMQARLSGTEDSSESVLDAQMNAYLSMENLAEYTKDQNALLLRRMERAKQLLASARGDSLSLAESDAIDIAELIGKCGTVPDRDFETEDWLLSNFPHERETGLGFVSACNGVDRSDESLKVAARLVSDVLESEAAGAELSALQIVVNYPVLRSQLDEERIIGALEEQVASGSIEGVLSYIDFAQEGPRKLAGLIALERIAEELDLYPLLMNAQTEGGQAIPGVFASYQALRTELEADLSGIEVEAATELADSWR